MTIFEVGQKALMKGRGTPEEMTVTVVGIENYPMILVRLHDGREEENAEFTLQPLD